MERRGELVTREEIAACLWEDPRTIDVANGINTAVNRLRRNLQETPGATAPIETVIGLGYRFDPVLDQLEPREDASKLAHSTAEPAETGLPEGLKYAASDDGTQTAETIAIGEAPSVDTPGEDTHYVPRLPETRDADAAAPPPVLARAG